MKHIVFLSHILVVIYAVIVVVGWVSYDVNVIYEFIWGHPLYEAIFIMILTTSVTDQLYPRKKG